MFELIFAITLTALGFFVGRSLEAKHYRSINAREQEFQPLLTYSVKTLPEDIAQQCTNAQLVCGSVVVSIDRFKQLLAYLRGVFGGRVSSYETLLDRGRREAILRMKEQASKLNAPMIYNVRVETASISKGQADRVGCIEVFAYGTALELSKGTSE